MSLPFELNAENLVKFAHENGIKLARVATGTKQMCARALVTFASIGLSIDFDSQEFVDMYSNVTEFSSEEMDALEKGFEGYQNVHRELQGHPFCQIGREIYELSRDN